MSLTGVVARLWNGGGKQPTQSANAPSRLIVEERYEENGKPYIKVSRGGRLITLGLDPDYVEPQDSIEKRLVEGVPEIAPGKWLPLGLGDYKSVFRPEDGKAGYVVKRFNTAFSTPEQAENAANAYRKAYDIINDEIGPHLLSVRDVRVGSSGHGFGIYKLQDYGRLTSAWLLGGEKREAALDASRAVTRAINSSMGRIEERLAAAGISHSPLHFDHAWVYNLGRPMVYDVLDSASWRQVPKADTHKSAA